ETQFDYLALALGERPQDLADPLAQQPLVRVLAGADRPVIAQKLLQRALALAADRLVQTHPGAPADPPRTGFVRLDPQDLRDFLNARFATRANGDLAAHALNGRQHPDLVTRHAHGPGVVG